MKVVILSKATEVESESGYDDDHQATRVSEGVTSSRSVLERVQHIEQHCGHQPHQLIYIHINPDLSTHIQIHIIISFMHA